MLLISKHSNLAFDFNLPSAEIQKQANGMVRFHPILSILFILSTNLPLYGIMRRRYFERQHGDIVCQRRCIAPLSEIINALVNPFIQRTVSGRLNKPHKTVIAEHGAGLVGRFGDAIRVEQQTVAGLELKAMLFILWFVDDAHWKPVTFKMPCWAPQANQDGRWMAGNGVLCSVCVSRSSTA